MQQPTDAIVRMDADAICGNGLHPCSVLSSWPVADRSTDPVRWLIPSTIPVRNRRTDQHDQSTPHRTELCTVEITTGPHLTSFRIKSADDGHVQVFIPRRLGHHESAAATWDRIFDFFHRHLLDPAPPAEISPPENPKTC
ncbi:hypothetical protein [Saccharopolyspora sp. NPDC002376]